MKFSRNNKGLKPDEDGFYTVTLSKIHTGSKHYPGIEKALESFINRMAMSDVDIHGEFGVPVNPSNIEENAKKDFVDLTRVTFIVDKVWLTNRADEIIVMGNIYVEGTGPLVDAMLENFNDEEKCNLFEIRTCFTSKKEFEIITWDYST